jgi:hypothetical protein
MKKLLFFAVSLLIALPFSKVYAQKDIPMEYELLYTQSFDEKSAFNEFRFSDVSAWGLNKEKRGYSLQTTGESTYKPPVRSPQNLAILHNKVFGDFILEVELSQSGRVYNHQDMVIVFGMRDSSHFYYVHLAPAPDEHAHNIFVVNGSPREKIMPVQEKGIDWSSKKWHKVRIERNIVNEEINVYFDDMSKPVFSTKDRTFIMGKIGFGSFDDQGFIDNIKVWGPTVLNDEEAIFK